MRAQQNQSTQYHKGKDTGHDLLTMLSIHYDTNSRSLFIKYVQCLINNTYVLSINVQHLSLHLSAGRSI